MDLKNSFQQGISSSMSVNIGNESNSSKLVNEVIFQLDTYKKELNEAREQIEQLSHKMMAKEVRGDLRKEKEEMTFNREEVARMLKDAFIEDRRKHSFDEKMEHFESKLREL